MPNDYAMPDSTPGNQVFPQFATLYNLVAPEVEGLTDDQLDWESQQWEWAKWSIRRQVSHMASFIPGWLLRQWGSRLFPDGFDELGDLQRTRTLSRNSGIVRWLDETEYHRLGRHPGPAGQGPRPRPLRALQGNPGFAQGRRKFPAPTLRPTGPSSSRPTPAESAGIPRRPSSLT